MKLVFPDLHSNNCTKMQICGHVTDLDKAESSVKKLFKKATLIQAKFKAGSTFHFVQIQSSSKGHFHIDLYSKLYFRDPPKPENKIQEVRSFVTKLYGHSVFANIEVSYLLEKQDGIPAIVKNELIEADSGQIKLRTTAGAFAIEGAPINELIWSIIKDDPSYLLVTLRGDLELEISSEMLIDAWAFAEAGSVFLEN